MVRHGREPFLECSSQGDKRFSAFFARIRCRENRTIEEIYQGAKVFSDGSSGLTIKQAKGRKPVNVLEVAALYRELWMDYLMENPFLLPVLEEATGLSDVFGKEGSNCQATVLWEIRQEITA